jgi:hypothetical protein
MATSIGDRLERREVWAPDIGLTSQILGMKCVDIIRAMQKDPDARFKTALQVVGIAGLMGMLAMIFHKGFSDISVLWQQHSGAEFWAALARYMLRNLAG